jgi:hypothetical protein
MLNKTKPTTISSVNDLNDFYWLKTELAAKCRSLGLSSSGAKQILARRIERFLTSGEKVLSSTMGNKGLRDSEKPITKKMLVRHYRNDQKTRAFFVAHIGRKFKFNHYLRQFADPSKITPNLTYDDLIEGWILFETQKCSSDKIPKQFEYNQFIKDYFFHETIGTLGQAINAWKQVKSKSGPNTYEQYVAGLC